MGLLRFVSPQKWDNSEQNGAAWSCSVLPGNGASIQYNCQILILPPPHLPGSKKVCCPPLPPPDNPTPRFPTSQPLLAKLS